MYSIWETNSHIALWSYSNLKMLLAVYMHNYILGIGK